MIAGNRSNGRGDGVYCTESSATRLVNSIIWGNCRDQVSVTGSSVQVAYCCVESGCAGTGNTSGDPVFEDALGGEYHLLSGSSCIDGGELGPAYNDADASRNDIGAYGGPAGSGSLGNRHPVAYAQSVTTGVGTAKAITLGASDGNSDPLTYAIVTPPSNGVLSGTAPAMTYTPSAGYRGPDRFTFKVNDGEDDSRVGTALISVERAPLWVLGARNDSDGEFDQGDFNLDFYPESEPVSEFPKELNTNWLPNVYLHFPLSEAQADAGLEIGLKPAWNDGSGVLYVGIEVWNGSGWVEGDRTPCNMHDGGYLYVHPALTKVGGNDMRLVAYRGTAGTGAVTWDQIVFKLQSQEIAWDFGTNDASSADLQQTDFDLTVNADTAADTNFPKELNTTWYRYQYINFTLDAAEAQRPHLLDLDVAWNDGSGTVEVVLQRWDGSWMNVGTAKVSTVSPGVIEVPADALKTGVNEWRLYGAAGTSNTTVVCWDRVSLLARIRPPDAVLELLDDVMNTSINFFLSTNAVHYGGLPLTALKATDRSRFGYSNPTEWGYAIQSWIAGAEAGKLAVTTAVALIDNSLMTMLTLQADPEQFKYGLFYPYYTVVGPAGLDVDFPYHDAYHELPSGDCALLWGSLNVAQGWLLQKGWPVTAAKAAKVKDAIDFHSCYVQTNGGEYISMLINADTGVLNSNTWKIWADEGGVVNIMSYFSGSTSADEFMGILDSQWRPSASWNGITTAESAWFSAAFTWPQRTMMGVPMLDDEPARRFGLHSFIPAARGHLAYARHAGVDYVGFSDAMTQRSGGQPLVGRYTPPNIPNTVEVNPPAHIQPHGAFVWMGALDVLEDSLLKAYFEKILLLKNDTHGYWHPGYSQDPYGFEVVASPTMNAAGYNGADDGRYIFESLSVGYTILPIYEGLARVRGGMGFAGFAWHVPGYAQTVEDALAYAYEGTPIGP